MAYDSLTRVTAKFPNVHIEALPISVAAFTTTKLVRRHASKFIAKWHPELILSSGLSRGDFSDVGIALGVPILKGTRRLSALPILLNDLENFIPILSPKISADGLIREKQCQLLQERIAMIEKSSLHLPRTFRLRSNLSVGIDLPPRVMAEIVDATSRSMEEGLDKARKLSKWADILDIGATVDKPNPEKISEIVAEFRQFGLPVSIDSLNAEEISAGVDAGAEIVLSVDRGNLNVISSLPEDVAFVCLPTNVSKGIFPRDPQDRARICHELCDKLRSQGYEKLLADPLLEAPIQPGLMQSLSAYLYYQQLNPDQPLLAGFGNVTEFVDADPAGMNALLACLGIELGISVFLSTEERAATIHSIREIHSASMMAFAAKIANSPPKDTGFTSFVIKTSRFDPQPVDDAQDFVIAHEKDLEKQLDPKGCFRIGVDHQGGRILCEHRIQGNRTLLLASDKANGLLQMIMEKGLISQLDHAAYLGSELTKAEISLRIGYNYLQDEPWETSRGNNVRYFK